MILPVGGLHHDEYVPPLAVLQNWNAPPALPICVAKIDGKGLGVVARYTLPADTTVARYDSRVVSRGHAPAPGDYRVDVTRYLVGKLDARSFGQPVDGVANVGPLLNEATTRSGEVTNCARTATELTGSQGHRRGAFFLRTTREVYMLGRSSCGIMVQTSARDCTSDADSPCYVPAETDLQSVCQGVLSLDTYPMCVALGFNVILAVVR